MVEALLRNKPTSMEGFTEPTQEQEGAFQCRPFSEGVLSTVLLSLAATTLLLLFFFLPRLQKTMEIASPLQAVVAE